MVVYGEISNFLSDPTEFFVSSYIKNVGTYHVSFSKKNQVIKYVIAKRPLTNLYEMNSNKNLLVFDKDLFLLGLCFL